MPNRTDKPSKEGEDGREETRQPVAPDLDTDQLARSRKPQMVPPGTIIEDDDDEHQVVEPDNPDIITTPTDPREAQ